MNTIKPWYLSKTIWASVVTLGVSAAGLFGFAADAVDQSALVETIMQLITAVSGLIAIVGRFHANSRLS
ncbi:hypothetical protein GCM10011491_22220 [Brucella endophytica]|uniref:Uncharacterized protein n=1 Tax=Brucella endophytica TaxID=1963359 RepID=A0A916SBZ9_9HYPH|nr:hypothetical protein [Brucella endophytica]GGA93581.1 hypothetical protein GCM10011491_22220 [Brucella endophytica]